MLLELLRVSLFQVSTISIVCDLHHRRNKFLTKYLLQMRNLLFFRSRGGKDFLCLALQRFGNVAVNFVSKDILRRSDDKFIRKLDFTFAVYRQILPCFR